MNGTYYNNPTFPNGEETPPANMGTESIMPLESSLIENILRLNKEKKVKVFATFPDSGPETNKTFEGVIKQSGRDHLILYNDISNTWYLIKMLYINYIIFDKVINYNPDYSDTFK